MPASPLPVMGEARPINADWTVLPSFLPVPGMGGLPVNSFLLKGPEPLLVDTGLAALGPQWLSALEGVLDPEDIAWIWVSHMDADHIGNLARLLARAPKARVITNFLGAGKMGMLGLGTDRLHLLAPGDTLDVGDRRLVPVRPPYYDAPETIGFFDTKDRVLFAADSFGALLPEAAERIEDVGEATLRDGLVAWSSIDAPWLTHLGETALGSLLGALERLDPDHVLSGHLPAAGKDVARLTRHLAAAYGRGADPAADPLAADHVAAAFG